MNERKEMLEETVEIMETFGKRMKAPVYKVEKLVGKDFYKTVVFVLLSSRTKDEVSIGAARRLFKKAGSFEELAKLTEKKVASLIYPVGFYRQKARHLIANSRKVVKEGIPKEISELDGIGRKGRNVILALLGKDEIGVDTHVHKIANRLGLVKTKKPEETEKELKKLFPRRLWKRLNKAFVGYGQVLCKAKPMCNICIIKWCPSRNIGGL